MTEVSKRTLDSVDALVGEWSMQPSFGTVEADEPRAQTTFEWLAGRRGISSRTYAHRVVDRDSRHCADDAAGGVVSVEDLMRCPR